MSNSGKVPQDELSSEDVEQRLNSWKTNIDAIKRGYFTEALHIGDVETRLDEAQLKLYNWIANVKLMQEKQRMLGQVLDFVDARQQELSEEVAHIDVPADGADDSISTTVDEINEKLAGLNIEISKRTGEDSTDPKIVIAKILNAQLSALETLNQRIVQLRRDVERVDSSEPSQYDELGSVYDNLHLRGIEEEDE